MTLITLYLFISGTSNLTKMLRGDWVVSQFVIGSNYYLL
jgi:hypothetical protein